MQKIESRELTRIEFPQWDALVDSSPHGTIFHKSGWLDICSHTLGKNIRIFGCFLDGTLVGGCPLYIHHKWGIFPVAVSTCAMSYYGGFVLSSSQSPRVHKQESFSRQIIESLIGCIKNEHFFTVVVHNSPAFHDIRSFTLNNWRSQVRYAYYFDLGLNIESQIDNRMKKEIRKAEEGRFIIETSSDISKYYALLCETYNRKNLTPPASKRLMTELYSFIAKENCGEMVVAKTVDNDEIACAEIILWDKGQSYRWSASSSKTFLELGAPSFLLFNILKRLQKQGIPRINLFAANTPQLSVFISKFNPVLVPYYQVQSWIFDDILPFKN